MQILLVCFCLKRHHPGPLRSGGQNFIFLFVCSRIEGPHAELEKGPSTGLDDVYGPELHAPPEKLPAEEIKPTIDTPRGFGKLLAATQILDGMLNNYDHRLRPGIGGE